MSVLELGAGQGLAGMSASFMGASEVVLTDLDANLPGLISNVELNSAQEHVRVQSLDWMKPVPVSLAGRCFDVILGADIVWVEWLVEPLVKTLHSLASTACNKLVEIFLAHQTRSERIDTLLFDLLRRYGFEWDRISDSEQHPIYRKHTTSLYRIRPKHQ